MKSRGLGDDIEKFFKRTGVKTVVDQAAEGLNIPCGCSARQAWFNDKVPYNK